MIAEKSVGSAGGSLSAWLLPSCWPQYRAIMAKKHDQENEQGQSGGEEGQEGQGRQVKPAKARAKADAKALAWRASPR